MTPLDLQKIFQGNMQNRKDLFNRIRQECTEVSCTTTAQITVYYVIWDIKEALCTGNNLLNVYFPS